MIKDSKARQEDVLSMIVRRYAETAEPVGSRYISRKLGLSSATIRNVMADLEEMGLITQPHTSAGRIPTDRGYRYYIDSLMRLKQVNAHMVLAVKDELHHAMRSIEGVLERTSHLISQFTNYVGITMFPQYDRMYLDGASHIIEQPEFRDLKKLYAILKCLEEKHDILEVLSHDLESERLIIHIGKENKHTNLNDCSVVTRGYKTKKGLSGRLGVIGPKRMAYEKVIPTIDVLADMVSEMLGGLEDE